MPRDSNGNYTKPNPSVVAGTTVQAAYENTNTDDQATELTDSLSRSGKGAMLEALKLSDSGLTFGAEPTTDARRAGAGDIRWRVLGDEVLQLVQAGIQSFKQLFIADIGIAFQSEQTSTLRREAPGDIRLQATGTDVLRTRPDSKEIEIYDSGTAALVQARAVSASQSALQAEQIPAAGTLRYVRARATDGDGGHGWFRFDASNLASQVSADPQKGIYVPPNSDTTGASGAWVRQCSGAVNAEWYGLDLTGLNAALASAYDVRINREYLVASAVIMGTAGKRFFSENQATLKANTGFVGNSLLSVTANNCAVDGISFDQDSKITSGNSVIIGPAEDVRILNCKSQNAESAFVYSASQVIKKIEVSGCRHTGKGYGVLINQPSANSEGLYVSNNVFDLQGQNGDCIEINAPANGFADVSIIDNRCMNAAGNAQNMGIGIGLARCANVNIVGNLVKDCSNDGIHAEDRSENFSIIGNDVKNCVGTASNSSGAISITGSFDGVIEANNISAINNIGAIVLQDSVGGVAVSNVGVNNNTIKGVTGDGIVMSGCVNVSANGNKVINGTLNGIRLVKFRAINFRSVIVRDNVIADGTPNTWQNAINLESDASIDQGQVIGNDVSGCTNNTILRAAANQLSRRANVYSTDAIFASATLTAGTTTVVANRNAQAVYGVRLYPNDAAAAALNMHCSAVAAGTSFTITHDTAVGNEVIRYEINN